MLAVFYRLPLLVLVAVRRFAQRLLSYSLITRHASAKAPKLDLNQNSALSFCLS